MTEPSPPAPGQWQTQPQPLGAPKRKRWPWIAGIVAAFFIGLAIGAAGGSSDDGSSTTATVPQATVTVTATPQASAPAPTATVTKTTTVKVTPQPKAEISEGVWVVGTDIRPGTYRTIEAVSDGCYWEIDRKPGSDDIVSNANPTGGRPTVNLRDGQQFITQGCGDWARS